MCTCRCSNGSFFVVVDAVGTGSLVVVVAFVVDFIAAVVVLVFLLFLL